jgi:hypothetical protein
MLSNSVRKDFSMCFPETFARGSQDTMKQELEAAGFKNIVTQREGTNFVVTAVKPSI